MSKRRAPGKPDRQQTDKTVKLTFSVPADVAKKFSHYAIEAEMSKTSLFIDLVNDHCGRFVVSDRGKGKAGETEAA